ncbi:MAG: hypothetical protein IJP82_02305 [Bacteroidaceae bacterium]|nr:hypothetical protein [Bacteroidaceae bacterium]
MSEQKKYTCTKAEASHLRLERGFDEAAVIIPCEVENGRYRIWPERLAVLGVSEDAIPEKAADGTPIIIA